MPAPPRAKTVFRTPGLAQRNLFDDTPPAAAHQAGSGPVSHLHKAGSRGARAPRYRPVGGSFPVVTAR